MGLIIMNKYFYLAHKIKQGTAFAYTEGETPISYELVPELRNKTEVPFDLILKKVSRVKGGWQESTDLSGLNYLWLDYQPNNLAWPLMSEKMKDVISSHLTGKEGIIWMPIIVRSTNEQRTYFIPRFERQLDVLDKEKTIYVEGSLLVVKPVFSLAKIVDYGLFNVPDEFWEITSGLYVGEALKKAMQKEKLTGVGFEPTAVTHLTVL